VLLAAGSVVVLNADDPHRTRLLKTVQSQADGEKAHAKAILDGSWHEGNLAQFELDVATRAREESL